MLSSVEQSALCVVPSGVFVVFGAGLEAAVQDADGSVRELPQCGVATDFPGPDLVVVRPRAGLYERGERLHVQRGAQATIGGVPHP